MPHPARLVLEAGAEKAVGEKAAGRRAGKRTPRRGSGRPATSAEPRPPRSGHRGRRSHASRNRRSVGAAAILADRRWGLCRARGNPASVRTISRAVRWYSQECCLSPPWRRLVLPDRRAGLLSSRRRCARCGDLRRVLASACSIAGLGVPAPAGSSRAKRPARAVARRQGRAADSREGISLACPRSRWPIPSSSSTATR